MNVKITKKEHVYLCSLDYKEYLFGSKLHGIAHKDSDSDYIRIIDDLIYEKFNTVAKYLPNIHSWQYDDADNNSQYVWLTERQFYHNLFSGDGNMLADVVLFSEYFQENAMFYCRTQKIIKGYLGVTKRDLKLHGNIDKKKFHAFRSLYMAESLMDGILPTVEGVKKLKQLELPTREELFDMEKSLRSRLNEMFKNKEISNYPKFTESNDLLQIMTNCNNVGEFKY